jgi:conjugative relaxase-like TrwC/TraI family protein
MLSANRISAPPAATAKYYAVGDYYTKGDDEPSSWGGEGAARLGLSGAVDGDRLEKLLAGALPEGQDAAWKRQGAEHHPGWDFTLSAPKSASVAAVLGQDERLIDAHAEASKTAIEFLERYAGVRVRENGALLYRETGNLVVASFTEFFSREREANLHEHNVVMNMTFDAATEKWRAVDDRRLYAALRAAGQVYQNEFARSTVALGYDVDWNVKQGTFNLSAVPQALIEQNSTRSKQIDDYVKERGQEGIEARERAALATRQGKESGDARALIDEGRAKGGAETERLDAVIDAARETARERAAPLPETAKAIDIARAMRFAFGHASAAEAVIEEADLVRYALQAGGPSVRLADVDKALTRFKDTGQLLSPAEQTGPKRLYRARLLSKDLAAEQKFWGLIDAGKDSVAPLLKDGTADRRLGGFRISVDEEGRRRDYPLSPEQHAAAKAILTSTARVHYVQGVGGAGKSAMVGAIKGALPLRAHLAIAKTAIAAAGLGKEAGVPFMTVDKFLSEAASAIPQGGVLYVDEASMLGTRAAGRIAQLAESAKFRVVVIGDKAQLGAIEQGKPHELAGRLGADVAELKDSRRHKTEAVKAAVTAAREGRIGAALGAIDHVHARDLKDLAASAAADFLASKSREREKLLVLDNKTRVAVSEEVRRHLVEEGAVDREGRKVKILSTHPMTEAQKKFAAFYPTGKAEIEFHEGSEALQAPKGARFAIVGRDRDGLILERADRPPRARCAERVLWRPGRSSVKGVTVYDAQTREIAQGDLIQWKRNDPSLDHVRNGLEGKVQSLDGAKATIRFSDGKTRTIDVEKNPHWDHAYALTVYKAQGATFDRAIVVAPATPGPLLNQKTFYTALSRARTAIDLYTNDPVKLEKALTDAPGGKTSALEATGRIAPQKSLAREERFQELPPSEGSAASVTIPPKSATSGAAKTADAAPDPAREPQAAQGIRFEINAEAIAAKLARAFGREKAGKETPETEGPKRAADFEEREAREIAAIKAAREKGAGAPKSAAHETVRDSARDIDKGQEIER